MKNSRILTIRDLILSSFAPDTISYEYSSWYFEGKCSTKRDILQELLDIIPDITIDAFSLKKTGKNSYKYSVRFSFIEDEISFGEIFNLQDDYEEE
ncbi:MAG: hypothetical protein ABDH28_01800 [Brevinematia bacterium]